MDANQEAERLFEISRKPLDKEFVQAYFVIGLSLGYLLVITLQSKLLMVDDPEIWFQRSGSVLVIFALLIEAYVVSINNRLNPIGWADLDVDLLRKHYLHKHSRLQFILTFQLLVGTLIWGYGDLIYPIII